MTIQVISNEPKPAAEPKAEVIETQSAPVVETEQNAASESETEETEAKVETESGDESEQSEESNESEDKPKAKKGGFQRRIDKLNSRYNEERQRREALEQRLAQLEAGSTKPEKIEAKPEPVEGKPNAENFETHAEYVEALTEWKIEQREIKARAEKEKESLKSAQDKALNDHYAREKSFADKTEDYAEVIQDFIADAPKVTAAFEQSIVESEHGPEIMYMLAKDRKEFDRINSLSYAGIYKEIGKLEAKLSQASEPKQEIKKTTNAPKPITPIGSGKSSTTTKSLDEMSQAEYEAYRRKQEKMRSA